MTPTREELLDRLDEVINTYDEIDEAPGLTPFDNRVVTLLLDLREELEST